jgi:UDP:flavonoid glycosyltransferase YjiC (YdhE family)
MNDFEGRRIYFAPCGIGLGHISRSVLIAQKVMNRGGKVLCSTYLEGVHYAEKYGLPVVASPDLSIEVDITGSIDIKATVLSGINSITTFLDQIRFEIQVIQSFDPDLVFSDTRLSSIYAAKILKKPVILLLNQFHPRIPREKDTIFFRLLDGSVMTILGRSWALSNIILIPDFPEPFTISLDSLRIPRRIGARVNLVGSILQKSPRNNSEINRTRETLGVEKDQTLVYAGISGPRAERLPLINRLIPIFRKFPDRYKIIMSMGIPKGNSQIIKKGNLYLVPWIENRFDYLEACDIVVSRGGHETLMQSISYGKPSVIIPVPKHTEQYGNARRAKELGIAKALHQKDLTLDHLLKRIDQLINSKKTRATLEGIINNKKLAKGLDKTIEAIAEFLKNERI